MKPSLTNRILDAFPSGRYGLLGLLRLLDIVETDEVPTAAIECSALPRMRINRAFVDTFAATAEKLLMLVLHELHHLLLGHTRLFPRPTAAHNLVFDAVINAMLCQMFPGAEYTSMFTDFYSDERFPECFLRPPSGWSPRMRAAAPPALQDSRFDEIRSAYIALYSPTSISYHELFRLLTSELRIDSQPVLLGNHEGEIPQLESSAALFEAVRVIVEQWPQPPTPIEGRSWASLLEPTNVAVAKEVSDRELLSGLIRRIGRAGNCGRPRIRGGWSEAIVPAPRPDRRSMVLRALGAETMLFRTETWSPLSRGGLDPVHVYLDVSGSVTGLLPELYAAVCSCRELVYPAVHLFSTRVYDLAIPGLLKGECRTTGGTDISCVAEHIRECGIRRAVIVTDGAVGAASGEHARTLRECRLGVALTPRYSIRGDLESYANFLIELRGTK